MTTGPFYIGGAVQTGYLFAYKNNYDIAVQMDGDGQHNPKFLKCLVKPIENNKADMVIGSRFIDKEGFQSTAVRRIGIKFFSYLIYFLTGKLVLDTTSGFRACNKTVIKMFAFDYPIDYPEPETNERLLNLSFRVLEVPVVMNMRLTGSSSITMFKSFWYMIKVTLAILIGHLKGTIKE